MQDKELVFLDTEFSSLDPYEGEVLSIGLVKPNGEEFYTELQYGGPANDWVKNNILPTLKNQIPREEAKQKVWDFIGDSNPLPVGFICQFDIVYLHKLFGWEDKDVPFGFPPIDFSSILMGKGYDPIEYLDHQAKFAKKLDINYKDITRHNALDDAKFMKRVWEKVINDS